MCTMPEAVAALNGMPEFFPLLFQLREDSDELVSPHPGPSPRPLALAPHPGPSPRPLTLALVPTRALLLLPPPTRSWGTAPTLVTQA